MATFYKVLQKLITIFEDDPDISVFLLAKYKKSLTAKIGYRKREEITLDMHPLSAITQPSFHPLEKKDKTAFREYKVHTYFYIYQEDKAKAVEEMIELEGLVNAAIRKDQTLGGLVREAYADEGIANDEGVYHPSYAFVMPLTVIARRTFPDAEEVIGDLEGIDIEIDQVPPGDGNPDVVGKVDFPQN